MFRFCSAGVCSRKTSEASSLSGAVYYQDELAGRGGNWVDGSALQGTRQIQWDKNHHLAKVRVAGSKPVFRSNKGPGQQAKMRSQRPAVCSGLQFITGLGRGLVMQVLVVAVQNAIQRSALGAATATATFFRTSGSVRDGGPRCRHCQTA